ncbi:hypothetical protein ACQ4M3_20720 [Leptolyngbya sp. AN03gr2]|uniref:hypothetical protein n=1 Tax=unclassified Leptolyngbya TaxID=2650499 RepID=UPI003D322566
MQANNMVLDAFEVRQRMFLYIQNVLESAHPVFSGLPICPFARSSRLQKKIDCWVYRFTFGDCQLSSEVYSKIESFSRQSTFDVLLVVHPQPNAMSVAELNSFIALLSEQTDALGVTVFGGHPDDLFEVEGVRTRQDPFINFTVQKTDKLASARQMLRATAYYNFWSDDARAAIGFE